MTQSRKLKRFKGRPVKTTDPTVEEWIEDAKASSDSKGLTKEKTALSLLGHLAGEARRERRRNQEQPRANLCSTPESFWGWGEPPQLQQQFLSYHQFCALVEHKIVTTDERPIKILHLRVPPHQWQEVKDYIQKSL